MMMLTTTAEHPLSYIGIADAGIVALLGYAVVFFGLFLLMIVVTVMGKAFVAVEKKNAPKVPKAAEPAPMVAPVAPAEPEAAPGTAGQLKLYDTPPKTAAMIMAIVADKMGKPLNELRFISIKEVKE